MIYWDLSQFYQMKRWKTVFTKKFAKKYVCQLSLAWYPKNPSMSKIF